MSTMKTNQTVYQGPNTSSKTYNTVGSVSANETVTFMWKETAGSTDWAYIEYSVSGTRYRKCGYVPYNQVNSPGTSTFTPSMSARYVRRGCIPFFGPLNKGYSETSDITRGSAVSYTGKKIGNYAFVESGNRRFWMYDNNLSTSAPTDADFNSLDFPYNFCQHDDAWQSLNPNFSTAGCAVCCAADVASFVEGTSLDPSVMKSRNVFTSTNISCNWSKASDECDWRPTSSPSNYLEKIKHHVNSGLPVIVRLNNPSTGNDHWVVAYGYNNSAATSSNIFIKDPYNSANTTLSQAMATRNYSALKYIFLYND